MGNIILKLDEIMSDRKISLKDLADSVGISNVNLSKIKTGKASAIRFSTLANLCESLRCQPGDIIQYVSDTTWQEGYDTEQMNPTKLKVGDIIQLGVYPQGEHGEIQPIEWIIVDLYDNIATIVSKYILDAVCYNETSDTDQWKDCTLRKWLNSDFYRESKLIEAPLIITELEDDVTDPLYILSIDETYQYFNNNRGAQGTAYARNNNLHTIENGKFKGNGYYWLRTQCFYPGKHSLVNINGEVLQMGPSITSTNTGIRPAARVLIDLL